MLKSTDNILHKPIENTLSIQTCPYAELLLTYMIIFEALPTGVSASPSKKRKPN
jgi:hypothetical protein